MVIYDPIRWMTDDVITAVKLNKVDQGIIDVANAINSITENLSNMESSIQSITNALNNPKIYHVDINTGNTQHTGDIVKSLNKTWQQIKDILTQKGVIIALENINGTIHEYLIQSIKSENNIYKVVINNVEYTANEPDNFPTCYI